MLTSTPTFSLRNAEEYVFANGTPWQQAYWRASFGWGPVEVFLFELDPYLTAVGAWAPEFAHSDCPLTAASLGLLLLGNLNLGEDIFEVGPRAFGWVAAQQGTDGLWHGRGNGSDTVAHSVLLATALKQYGDHPDAVTSTIAALTGIAQEALLADPVTCAHWLALCHAESHPGATACHQTAYAHLNHHLHTHAGTPHQWYHAHQMARRSHLSIVDPIRATAWQRLVASQNSDGGWPDPRGVYFRVLTTIFAARSVVSR